MVLSAKAPPAALLLACRRFFKNQNRANNTAAAPNNPPMTPPAMAPVLLVDEEVSLLLEASVDNVGLDDGVSPASDDWEGDAAGVLSLPEEPLSLVPLPLLPSFVDEDGAKTKHVCTSLILHVLLFYAKDD